MLMPPYGARPEASIVGFVADGVRSSEESAFSILPESFSTFVMLGEREECDEARVDFLFLRIINFFLLLSSNLFTSERVYSGFLVSDRRCCNGLMALPEDDLFNKSVGLLVVSWRTGRRVLAFPVAASLAPP